MKSIRILFVIILSILSISPAFAWRKWEYINPSDIEIKIKPSLPEITAGETATFTITIRNRTDKTVNIFFPTGQRWDLATYHNGTQIFRWSQGYDWEDAPHSVPIRAGKSMSEQLSWKTVDRLGRDLPMGVYRAQGMVMTKPRHLVSNMCSIRLIPSSIKKQKIIQTRIGKFFNIVLPRYSDTNELIWKVNYIYNDNRVSIHKVSKEGKKTTIIFKARRRGHVIIQLYAFFDYHKIDKAVERRSFRVEVR